MKDRKGLELVFHSRRQKTYQRWIKEKSGVGRTAKTGKKEVETFEFLREIIFWSIVGSQVEA